MANLSFKRIIENPVNSAATYNDTDYNELGFMAHRVQFIFRSGTNPIQFSINGSDDVCELGPTSGMMQAFECTEPTTAVWWKGGSGDEIIEIIASSQR